MRWAAIEAVSGPACERQLVSVKARVGARRGANIGRVAAARPLLTLVYYGLRDGERHHLIRVLDRSLIDELREDGLAVGEEEAVDTRVGTLTRGFELPEAGLFAAGNVFLPRDEQEAATCRETVEQVVRERGQKVIGWRPVPTDADAA